jgi:hypothetical protein
MGAELTRKITGRLSGVPFMELHRMSGKYAQARTVLNRKRRVKSRMAYLPEHQTLIRADEFALHR